MSCNVPLWLATRVSASAYQQGHSGLCWGVGLAYVIVLSSRAVMTASPIRGLLPRLLLPFVRRHQGC